jgi:hypothetical protein
MLGMKDIISIWWIFVGVIIISNILRMLIKYIRKNSLNYRLEELGKNLNDDNVKSFIDFVRKTTFMNEPSIWNALRASYKLVAEERSISIELKRELRQVLLSRGVNL